MFPLVALLFGGFFGVVFLFWLCCFVRGAFCFCRSFDWVLFGWFLWLFFFALTKLLCTWLACFSKGIIL